MKAGWIAIACAVIMGVGVALYSVNSHTFDDPSVIETRSPQGTYTVLFELKAEEPNAMGWFRGVCEIESDEELADLLCKRSILSWRFS